jgi:signal transduction histidine kinase
MAYSVAYWEALGHWLRRSLVVGLSAMAASAILFLALGQLMTATAREIEAERSLREAIDRERRAEIIALRNQDREIIARMAGGVGHEFNNLMAGILGIGETLAAAPATSEQLPHFGRSLIDVADRGGTLAHALMIYAGSGFLDFKVVDLGDCVRSAVEAFRTTVGRGTEIHLRMPDGPINTRVDPEKLAIALGHLLMNSLEALPDSQGRIDVDVTVTDDPPTGVTGTSMAAQRFASISIIDNGIGMDADVLARARDPFFTTREIGRGTGLGLSMVDGLILASDGRIEIESQPGKGTQVTMWLPLNDRVPDPRIWKT